MNERENEWLMNAADKMDERGFSSKNETFEVQTMTVDDTAQITLQSDMVNLINVSIKLPERSGILKERLCNVQRSRGFEAQKAGRGGKRKWKS